MATTHINSGEEGRVGGSEGHVPQCFIWGTPTGKVPQHLTFVLLYRAKAGRNGHFRPNILTMHQKHLVAGLPQKIWKNLQNMSSLNVTHMLVTLGYHQLFSNY